MVCVYNVYSITWNCLSFLLSYFNFCLYFFYICVCLKLMLLQLCVFLLLLSNTSFYRTTCMHFFSPLLTQWNNTHSHVDSKCALSLTFRHINVLSMSATYSSSSANVTSRQTKATSVWMWWKRFFVMNGCINYLLSKKAKPDLRGLDRVGKK